MTTEQSAQLQQTYLEYRQRLKKYFIVIDDPSIAGTNLPMSYRNLWGRDSSICGWGDTTIMMAYYICMLSSELWLCQENKTDMSVTLKELDYAAKSLDRLDMNAEMYWRGQNAPMQNDFNGFLLRDDVPLNILEKYPYLKESENSTLGIKQVGYDTQKLPQNKPILSEMSQDQMWHLYLGIGVSIEILNKVNDAESHAKQIVKMLKDFVLRTAKYMLITCKGNIMNPVTKKPVGAGANMTMFTWGFAKAAGEITGFDFDSYAGIAAKTMFNGMAWFSEGILYPHIAKQIKSIPVKDFAYNALCIVGNCWYKDFYFQHLCEKFERTTRYPAFPMMYYIIHGTGMGKSFKSLYDVDKLEGLLTSYQGSFNFGGTDVPKNPIWRWDLIMCDYNVANQTERWDLGSYNSIDFMLLHNLYRMIIDHGW